MKAEPHGKDLPSLKEPRRPPPLPEGRSGPALPYAVSEYWGAGVTQGQLGTLAPQKGGKASLAPLLWE